MDTQQDALSSFQPPVLAESTAKFMGISNIINGICRFNSPRTDAEIIQSYAQHLLQRRQRTRRSIDDKAKRLLRIAWHTELAARILDRAPSSPSDPEFLAILRRVASQTLPVQVYYSLFNAARAVTIVEGTPCRSHRSVHDDFASNRLGSAPGPWHVSIQGDPSTPSSCVITPLMTCDIAFNPIEQNRQPADYLGLGLRITSRWRLESLRRDWLQDGRNRTSKGQPYRVLPARGRQEILGRMRPTTLMDFVYELRRRANYESNDEYASDASDLSVALFHGGLLRLLDTGLLIYEAELGRCIGIAAYKEIHADWRRTVNRVGAWALTNFDARLAAIEQATSS